MTRIRENVGRWVALVGAALVACAAGWYASLYQIREPEDPRWWSRAEDLYVYWNAAGKVLHGGDVYLTDPGVFDYIYPPFAAIAALLLRPIPWPVTAIVWAALNGLMCLGVLHRLGFRQAWQLGFGVAATVLLLLPFESAIEFGQLGVLLLWLVVLDLIDPPGRRWLPQGVLIGLATAIKLTPAAFIVYLLLTRRFRAAAWACGVFAATVLAGFAVMPTAATGYWQRLMAGDSGANPAVYGLIWNISVMSTVQRFQGVEQGRTLGLILSAALLLLCLIAAWLAHRAGNELLALTAVGVGSTLANPVAWTHHLTWVLPGIVCLAQISAGGLRWVGLVCMGILTLEPQLRLPGSPGVTTEYGPGQLWLSTMPGFTALLFVVAVGVWALVSRPRGRRVSRARGCHSLPGQTIVPARALQDPLERS
ncbi:DUF2029 domain-containing protein [Naumannella sp. ID2617S]|nr:DUF2029 domain-containing protein [Naumannella sp. ID2617S]